MYYCADPTALLTGLSTFGSFASRTSFNEDIEFKFLAASICDKLNLESSKTGAFCELQLRFPCRTPSRDGERVLVAF